MNVKLKCSLISCFLLLLAGSLQAQIRLPQIIGSNMVLQRNQPLPVWGWAAAGKPVRVTFADQQKGTIANADGYWKVTLQPLKASSEPRTMTITSDTSKIELVNILVGEVWLASGQSNMEYVMKLIHARPAKGTDSAALELNTHMPQIRFLRLRKN